MKSHSILILEGDRVFAKALAQALNSGSERKCRVNLCTSARQVIPLMDQEQVDLLVLSDNLPEENWQSIIAEITRCFPDLKTIFMAGQGCPAPYDLARMGIQHCLPRPFDMLDFLLFVRQVLSSNGQLQTGKNTFSLLILEDDEGLRRIYSLALSKFESATIDQAATMDEARSLLENKDYDILISDVRIGRDRATDILAEFRHRFEANRTKIVLCSAFGQYRNLPADVDHFLEKPIPVDQLVQLVSDLIGIQANGSKGKQNEG